jgi:hypothetical protein
VIIKKAVRTIAPEREREMTIDIIEISSVLGALTVIAVFAFAILKFVKKKITEQIDTELKKVISWTDSQQKDIDVSAEEREILFEATRAILDWVIREQNGNGPCHAAMDEMDGFLSRRAHEKRSYAIGDKNK